MTTMTIYQPGQEPVSDTVDLSCDPGWNALRDLLAPIVGGTPEHVTVLFDGERRDMFVHEAGHIVGLEYNEAATQIYRNATMTRKPETNPKSLPYIVGPAVIFDRQVWF